MEPTQRQHYGCICRRIELRPSDRRCHCRVDDVGDEMCPLLWPAIALQVIDDTGCVANQVITAAIVFEIVVAAEPTDMYYLSATPRSYTRPARTVHPRQNDLRRESLNFGCETPLRGTIERSAKGEFYGIEPDVAKRCGARVMPSDDDALVDASVAQRTGEADEKRLGAADLTACHGLQHSHDDIHGSKAAAAAVQLQIRRKALA